MTSLSVLNGQLGVGIKGPGKSVLINLANHSQYTVIAKTGVMFRQLGNDVFFVKEPGVWSYNMVTKKITQILTEDVGAMWGGLDVYGNKALTVSSYDVIEIDPVAKTAVKHDLTEAGAPGGPQSCMGLAAGAGDVYVGGTGTIARHQLATNQVSYLRATGEAKDAVVVGGILYTGQYNSRGIYSYDPSTGGELPYQVAALPAGQNRPLDVCWDAVNGLVIAGAQNDTGGGGCFAAYKPSTTQVITKVNPIDALQMVRAVATKDGVAYLGGDNIYAAGPPRSTVVAWDLWPTRSCGAWIPGSRKASRQWLSTASSSMACPARPPDFSSSTWTPAKWFTGVTSAACAPTSAPSKSAGGESCTACPTPPFSASTPPRSRCPLLWQTSTEAGTADRTSQPTRTGCSTHSGGAQPRPDRRSAGDANYAALTRVAPK